MHRIAAATAMVLLCAGILSADTFGSGANQFDIDFVTISGDAGDLGSWPAGDGYTFTGVNRDDYRIGVYEVTNDQWDKFQAELGVPVTGDPSYAYGEDPDWTGTNVPTNEVSWYEAAQFVNWLNTSEGHQAAYKFTGTQGTSGYALDTWSAGEADGTNLYRHKDAFYYLPTEDEWVKAGYWNGSDLQTWATVGDVVPTAGVDSNYNQSYPHDGPWAVGSGSEELNGTFDMMGNVGEWMESPYFSGDYGTGSRRGLRGGSYYDVNDNGLASSYRFKVIPDLEIIFVGFRVASEVSITIPGDCDSDGDVDATDLAALGLNWDPAGMLKTWSDGDFDGDGDVDSVDLASLGLNWSPAGYSSPIPEPASLSLLAVGGMALLRRKR